MKTQILFIHGGMTFKNKKDYISYLKTRKIALKKKVKWSDSYLDKKLCDQFEIIRLNMPLKENAKYEEWKIHFERHISLVRDNIILMGSSLGGIFLAKYLSENKFPKKIRAIYLVCAPFDDSMSKEELVGGFKLKADLSMLEKNSKKIYLFFSKDDDIVPVSHAEKYRKKLRDVRITIFKSKNGHFQIAKFPEIIKMIKNDVKI